jgi:hypothetical protein
MPKYENAVVYKLCCDDPEITDIYVGSTCNFKVRKHQHKTACNNQNGKEYNRHVYKFIRENGGWDNWSMILIKKYPNVVDTYELHKKERKWLKKLKGTLNKQIPSRTREQWYNDNDEVIKQYYKKNKEKFKQYYETNKDMIRKQKQQYRKDNIEQIKAYKNEKIECECGCLISRNHLSRHRTTKKHVELINDK